MGKYSNITVARFRKILKALGLEQVRTKGGHEMWFKEGMLRNVVFQNHVEPIPEDIIKNNIRTIGISKEEFDAQLDEIK
jgi:predicted RNA binding protein YcfA (HicA-like mRNA interferase family)